MAAYLIDAFEFCRLAESREGETPVADFPRLSKEVEDGSGVLRWSVHGGSNQHGHSQLTVSVAGPVQLICQRCLAPFTFEIASGAVLIIAENESSADEIDGLLADEDVEVIVGSRSMNIADLIEDDALLALPLAPKHVTCPDQLVPPANSKQEKESPFSVLKNWKQ